MGVMWALAGQDFGVLIAVIWYIQLSFSTSARGGNYEEGQSLSLSVVSAWDAGCFR